MTQYSISEVAQLCGINPVTLRAWQRRYGLLKPQRSEGGHRKFDEQDIARIRSILNWIEKGVPVGQVKALLDGETLVEGCSSWQPLQQQLSTVLQCANADKLRQLIYEQGQEYPTELFINQVVRPLRRQLSGATDLLLSLRGLLDGILLDYATFCLRAARKKPGAKALLLAWTAMDRTELWLEAIILAQSGLRLEVLPDPLLAPPLQLLTADRYFIWAEGKLNARQNKQLHSWQQAGLDINLLGSSAQLSLRQSESQATI